MAEQATELESLAAQIGLIAEMIQSYEEEETPLQRRLDQLGRWLGAGSLIVCGLVFVIALLRDLHELDAQAMQHLELALEAR